jgi:hypothetical protein
MVAVETSVSFVEWLSASPREGAREWVLLPLLLPDEEPERRGSASG